MKQNFGMVLILLARGTSQNKFKEYKKSIIERNLFSKYLEGNGGFGKRFRFYGEWKTVPAAVFRQPNNWIDYGFNYDTNSSRQMTIENNQQLRATVVAGKTIFWRIKKYGTKPQ